VLSLRALLFCRGWLLMILKWWVGSGSKIEDCALLVLRMDLESRWLSPSLNRLKEWSACFALLFFSAVLACLVYCFVGAALLVIWLGATVLLLFRKTCVLVFLLCTLLSCSLNTSCMGDA
jgi:hypothetical protein